MTPRRQKNLADKIRRSRARLLVSDPDIAMVLMYINFAATKKVQRISTNGRTIFFDPDWLQKLSGKALDYILSHEVLHIVLYDTKRPAFLSGDRYHHACDIIACSLLQERGWSCEELPQIGRLPHRTYFPGHEGRELTPLEAYREVPFDPSTFTESERRRYRIDSDKYWGDSVYPDDAVLILSPGFEQLEPVDEDEAPAKIRVKYQVFQPATMRETGEDEVDVPEEGDPDETDTDVNLEAQGESSGLENCGDIELDDELKTKAEDFNDALDAAIDRLMNIIEEMEKGNARIQGLLERARISRGSSELEWRRLLANFLHEEINDYSFTPPDRRFADSDFFIPDFNQAETELKDIYFMVDSSGSVDDDIICEVYGEICAAIEQFDGKLEGKLSFFDTQVTHPVPFRTVPQLLKLRPKGGGGTDFGCIFRYIASSADKLPSCLVIFTDGMDEYPSESEALGVPVIWIIYGNTELPPWGKTARIKRKVRN